jgi:hypothetical protein
VSGDGMARRGMGRGSGGAGWRHGVVATFARTSQEDAGGGRSCVRQNAVTGASWRTRLRHLLRRPRRDSCAAYLRGRGFPRSDERSYEGVLLRGQTRSCERGYLGGVWGGSSDVRKRVVGLDEAARLEPDGPVFAGGMVFPRVFARRLFVPLWLCATCLLRLRGTKDFRTKAQSHKGSAPGAPAGTASPARGTGTSEAAPPRPNQIPAPAGTFLRTSLLRGGASALADTFLRTWLLRDSAALQCNEQALTHTLSPLNATNHH